MTNTNQIATARAALERVCSGACLEDKTKYYASEFVDHVNGQHLKGFVGITESVARYKRILSNLTITVQDHLSEGDRVLCRFTVTGDVYGRKVSFDGMTVSRFENGLIVEDWSVTDTLGMLRQVGWWRFLWIALRGHEIRANT